MLKTPYVWTGVCTRRFSQVMSGEMDPLRNMLNMLNMLNAERYAVIQAG